MTGAARGRRRWSELSDSGGSRCGAHPDPWRPSALRWVPAEQGPGIRAESRVPTRLVARTSQQHGLRLVCVKAVVQGDTDCSRVLEPFAHKVWHCMSR